MEGWLIFLGCGCVRWSTREPAYCNSAEICKQHPASMNNWPVASARVTEVTPWPRRS